MRGGAIFSGHTKYDPDKLRNEVLKCLDEAMSMLQQKMDALDEERKSINTGGKIDNLRSTVREAEDYALITEIS